MNMRYLPRLSLTIMMVIGAIGVFIVGFAHGFEADPGKRMVRRSVAPPADLAAALQDRRRWAVEEADDLSKILIALKPFCVMLNTEQKETADHRFAPSASGMMHGGPAELRGDGPSPQCQPFFRHEVR
jgi:hypothetical protein